MATGHAKHVRTGRWLRAAVRGLSAAALLLGACEAAGRTPGQLVVSVESDMALPQQIDSIRLQVQVRGETRFDYSYPVGTVTDTLIPATITLFDAEPSTPVVVRVAGSKQGDWRTFREAITTVPIDRVASLRMPVQWLCKGTAQRTAMMDNSPFGMPQLESTCGAGNTCRAGECRPSDVPIKTLPDYSEAKIFGGASLHAHGRCFDTLACMAAATAAHPDADCTIPKPSADAVNVALRVHDGGICSDDMSACFVPLDAESDEGWLTAGDRLQLPRAACAKLSQGDVDAIVVSTGCEEKSEAIPPCGDWSSVPSVNPIEPGPALSASSKVRQLTSLIATPGSQVPCCPLVEQDGRLYTCLCSSKTQVHLVATDLSHPEQSASIADLELSPARSQVRFAATISDGALYWADPRAVRRLPLGDPGAAATTLSVPMSIYEGTTMLADSGGVFMLASDDAVTSGDSVKLLKVTPTGDVSAFETGATRPVFQLAQDAGALYFVADRDDAQDGGVLSRASSVVALDKHSGERTTVMKERSVTTTAPLHGGYLGVQLDGSSVFALFEGTAADDGMAHVELHTIDVARTPAGDPTTLLDVVVDPNVTQLALLGVAAGTVLYSRIEYAPASAGSTPRVRASTLFALRPDNPNPTTLAAFDGDYPLPGLNADRDSLYWLNNSGSIFELPKSALE